MSPLLPNFPAEILEQWPYENGGVLETWSWLGLQGLGFRLETFPMTTVLKDVRHWSQSGMEMEAAKLEESSSYREWGVIGYVKANGTWPRPPIALDNRKARIERPHMGDDSPFILIEGMHRLAALTYFSAKSSVLPEHRLWVVHGWRPNPPGGWCV